MLPRVVEISDVAKNLFLNTKLMAHCMALHLHHVVFLGPLQFLLLTAFVYCVHVLA